jgi:hypothetical protein
MALSPEKAAGYPDVPGPSLAESVKLSLAKRSLSGLQGPRGPSPLLRVYISQKTRRIPLGRCGRLLWLFQFQKHTEEVFGQHSNIHVTVIRREGKIILDGLWYIWTALHTMSGWGEHVSTRNRT